MLASKHPWLQAYFHGKRAQSLVPGMKSWKVTAEWKPGPTTALIGLFTLAVVTAGFGFVFWFSGKDATAKQAVSASSSPDRSPASRAALS